MELTCRQFEGLITFYLDGELNERLKQSFEEHLKNCPTCNMKFKIIKSIIGDIKGAYDKLLVDYKGNDVLDDKPIELKTLNSEDITSIDLSAYIDNELNDENNIRIRRNIIAKPNIRLKLEKMYKLKKILSDSFSEHKNKLKTDYSKEIVRTLDSTITKKQICFHCILFIAIVILALIISVKIILSVI